MFEAYKKYDPHRYNVKFWSFAWRRVQGRMIDYIDRHSNFLKPGRTIARLANKIKKLDMVNWNAIEIAEAIDESTIQVNKALEFLRIKYVDSLNRIVNDDRGKNLELGDLLPTPFNYFETTEDNLWNSLNEDEQQYLNYKLQGYDVKKLQRAMHLTYEKQNEIETSLKYKARELFNNLESNAEEVRCMSSSQDKAILTKALYLKHKKSKMHDKDVCEKYSISRGNLVKLKASWGVSDPRSANMKQKTLAIASPPKNPVIHLSTIDGDTNTNQINALKEKISQLEGQLRETEEKLKMCENEREALWKIQDILRARFIV
ncbi:RNA polymerase sigma factor rpoD Sigma-70 [Paenibacillus macerans]|nr:RNA polymerase sigma factor rpoD Sigma-70 [Paenibacillus macerans]